MEFVTIPTEQTTAATDFLLGIIALYFVFRFKTSVSRLFGVVIWRFIFILLAVGAFLGSFFHGFEHTQEIKIILWFSLLLSLVFVVSLFVIAMIYDVKGEKSAKKSTFFILGIGIITYLVMVLLSGKFIILVGYEVIAMLSALIGYTMGALKAKTKDLWIMSLGVLVTIIAAAVQALTNIVIDFIWVFDKNGVFHIIQIAAVFLFFYAFKLRRWV